MIKQSVSLTKTDDLLAIDAKMSFDDNPFQAARGRTTA